MRESIFCCILRDCVNTSARYVALSDMESFKYDQLAALELYISELHASEFDRHCNHGCTFIGQSVKSGFRRSSINLTGDRLL